HAVEALIDLAPQAGEALIDVVAKGVQRAVGGIRAMLEHRGARLKIGGIGAGHRARSYRGWRCAGMPRHGLRSPNARASSAPTRPRALRSRKRRKMPDRFQRSTRCDGLPREPTLR